ncbi:MULTISPECIES: peroxide stress protein YaaA [Corynebacterium]|uniref:peroxide stress protein YaaA n=1 Tax=Corynebacterium TaxID=1716 RepID=UPI00124CB36E|nr:MULTISPECIES: peroxide stress protein YaaA [Corynebacterium]
MLIVLPPSETKSFGGDGAPLSLDSLGFPELTPLRQQIIDDLRALDAAEAREALKLKNNFDEEFAANQQLWTSPTTPALSRYTGVLFDALSPATLPHDRWSQLAVGSALFGVVRGQDLIPHYRLSAGTKVPRQEDPAAAAPTMKKRWGAAITEALSGVEGLVLDFRSGAYQNLGPLSSAATVRVETTAGKVVSHFNKHYKGELARVLCLHDAEPETLDEVIEIAQGAGLSISLSSPTQLTLVVDR